MCKSLQIQGSNSKDKIKMKRKFETINDGEESALRSSDRFKLEKRKVLQMSREKLQNITDAELCLRKAVLVRNTYILTQKLAFK